MPSLFILYAFNDRALPAPVWLEQYLLLPKAMQEKISRLRQWQDRQASLLGKLLLLEGFKKLGYTPDLSLIAFDENQRPFTTLPFDFNIAHAGKYVLAAFNTEGRIGIDVENIRPIQLPDFQSVLAPQEAAHLKQHPDPYRFFFHIWTKKEAVIKAEGRGIAHQLQLINTLDNPILLEDTYWHVQEVPLDAEHVCHFATAENRAGQAVEIEQVALQ
ncbi:MAG TPA: 4'-phosphopantetheinyl transferase superfamily protein [Saprospiraceae bacterium]|nr:4'-phosphopantetheinyl transferase superfamily protein [Saprospiraceae bacterium]HMQ82241.1 4'-phosphopantetheinyl transferase superfamily protein [Saprospiraceae bacterium]